MASQFDANAHQQQRHRHPNKPENRFDEADEFENDEDEDDDDDDDDDDDGADPVDRIRRSYHNHHHHSHHNHHHHHQAAARQPSSSGAEPGARLAGSARLPEPIQVKLNESFLAQERRVLVGALANVRQKLSSLQLFNPAANGAVKQQQEQEWSEKEKYTLDSLNEFKGPLDERFQWNKPDDGREVWPSKLQYFMAITSYSIGLGNVIRFPILVQKNGGLAFIIPFVIMLLLEGIPLFYLELAIGQRTRKAAISCWNLVSPFAVGIGLASAAVSFLIGLYYNTMVAWTLLYTWDSLVGGLPEPSSLGAVQQAEVKVAACPSPPQVTASSGEINGTTTLGESECQLSSPFEFYWYRETLNISSSVSDWSNFNWPVGFCLALAWLISYLCLVKGLSTSKRLVYFVSTFPYVILVIFLGKAVTLRGMEHGLAYLFAPKWDKLFDPYVWLQAAAQVFFSLGLGFGGLIALSSYNPVNNNCYKDAIKVSLINFGTSLIAGVVVFSILGYRANLHYDKCQVVREQQIDFYLADYNLKVLEYGAVFKQVPEASGGGGGGDDDKLKLQADDKVEQFMASRAVDGENGDNKKDKARILEGEESVGGEETNFSLDDAIDSITNLDRQLDLGSTSGSFDYGDSDTEFILNASALIDRAELDKIIENIESLPKCSIKRELDESTQGTGLVFVVMAEAISEFDTNSHAWAILFFLMILSLGLDSQFGNLEGLLSSLTDFNFNWNESKQATGNGCEDNHHHHHHQHHHQHQPGDGATTTTMGNHHDAATGGCTNLPIGNQRLERNQLIRAWATGVICLLSLVISLVIFAHGAGSYMFAIFDEYASSFSLVLIALFELLAISYIYGLKTFCDDCELMTGKRPPFLVLLSWRYISPIILMILVLATVKQFTVELNYDVWNVFLAHTGESDPDSLSSPHLESKEWPAWSIVFGVALIISCVVWIPVIAILRIMRINLIPDEQHRRWFPVEELKEFHQLQDQEHQVTKLERILFGFKQDDD